jgi:hypothetical protein
VSFIKKKIKIAQNQMILIFTDGDLYPRDGWSFGKQKCMTIFYSFWDDGGEAKGMPDKHSAA